MSNSVVLVPLAAIAGFAVLWCFILWLSSLAGGWRRLAERYENRMPFDGEITSFVTARLRFVNYSSILRLGTSDLGLYVAPIRIYRFFHPPLFIPWTDIEAEARPGGRLAWGGIRLEFAAVPRTSMTLYGRGADRVAAYVDS